MHRLLTAISFVAGIIYLIFIFYIIVWARMWGKRVNSVDLVRKRMRKGMLAIAISGLGTALPVAIIQVMLTAYAFWFELVSAPLFLASSLIMYIMSFKFMKAIKGFDWTANDAHKKQVYFRATMMVIAYSTYWLVVFLYVIIQIALDATTYKDNFIYRITEDTVTDGLEYFIIGCVIFILLPSKVNQNDSSSQSRSHPSRTSSRRSGFIRTTSVASVESQEPNDEWMELP